MGFSTVELKRLMGEKPMPVEAALPPLASVSPGETLYPVLRWDETCRPGFFIRNLIRLIYWLSCGRIRLEVQNFEEIGIASREDIADAACLDDTYVYHPMPLDVFLPRDPVSLPGVIAPRRLIHRLFWIRHNNEEQSGHLIVISRSEVDRLRAEIKALREILAELN